MSLEVSDMKDIDLNRLRISSPCPQNWSAMEGNDQTRHCKICATNVHNLAAMPAGEARVLLSQNKGKACLRITRNPAGEILTRDSDEKQATGLKYAWMRRIAASLLLGVSSILSSCKETSQAAATEPAGNAPDQSADGAPCETDVEYPDHILREIGYIDIDLIGEAEMSESDTESE